MRLYEGPVPKFLEDVAQNEITDKLRNAYLEYYKRNPSPNEARSWTNSLQFMRTVLDKGYLQGAEIILEHELPYSSERIDCILFGEGANNEENVIILELKQWEKVEDCDVEGNVITFVGGGNRMVPHPSMQVRGYHYYLKDFVSIFEDSNVKLSSGSYCHNYSHGDESVLFFPKFNELLKEHPVFAKQDFKKLGDFLHEKLGKGNGIELFNRFRTSRIAPSKKLMEHTHEMIKGQQVFHLIDEQIAANNAIIDRAKKCSKLKNKSVIIVRGGPGTGKSVIALNAIAELLSRGHKVYHATGSAAFTTTLRTIVGTRAAKLFHYFNSFSTTKTQENELDVLICDEAHRIRKTSNSRFTRKEHRSDIPQIDELIRVAKVSVFFIDEYQIVRPNEIGNVDTIKEAAKKVEADVFDFELQTQFRCSGSNGYLNWIDDTLGVRETANTMLTKKEKMEFKIFDSPQSLYDAIKQKNTEKANSARLVAGFCWPWSDAKPDGTLVEDVVIGDFKMTWEAKNESKRLAPGIPKASLWAHDPNGVDQIGSIYTIQGFEFDYVGVIFGPDLTFNSKTMKWDGHPEKSADSAVKRAKNFAEYAKNTYRVLMTRGMKGCYVYFTDKETERYFRNKIS